MRLFKGKKSWWLDDAQKLAREYPYTFHKPSSKAVRLLRPKDEVKLIFRFDSDNPEAPNAERMWVEIKKISGANFEGVLDNSPEYIADLKCGDPLTFQEKHIIQVSIDDPVPSETDKYVARCFVSHRVLKDGQKVGYCYREEPDNDKDSGWRFMSGDESDAYVDDPGNISFVSLGALLREDDSPLKLLESPVGSAFAVDPRTGAFVSVANG